MFYLLKKVISYLLSAVSNIVVVIVALILSNETNFHVFTDGNILGAKGVSKTQRLLVICHKILKLTEGKLKLTKYYLTL